MGWYDQSLQGTRGRLRNCFGHTRARFQGFHTSGSIRGVVSSKTSVGLCALVRGSGREPESLGRDDSGQFGAMKFYFHNKGDFLKSVRSLRRNGGPKQTAAERVEEMIGRIEWDANCLAHLPMERDERINHAMKYSLDRKSTRLNSSHRCISY